MDTNNFDFNKLGDRISNLVDDAINSQNFKELNQTINTTINQALNGVNKTLGNINRTYQFRSGPGGHPYQPNRPNTPLRTRPLQRQTPSVIYDRNPRGQISGSIKALIGFTLAGMDGIAAIVLIILALFGILNVGTTIALVLVLLFFAGGLLLGLSGKKALSRVKRFRQYCNAIGGQTYIELEDLEKRTGRTRKFLIQDLEEMIQSRMFRQAHLDHQKSFLMLTDDVYKQYLATMQALENRKKEEQALADAGFNSEFREVIKESESYIAKIHQANEELPGEVISGKLARLEVVITRILEEVKRQPKKASDLQKFMNYYLPTTWKLISAYLNFEKQPVQTDNIISTRTEIENTLDTINDAFEQLLDDLFQTQAWDISSDISVLQTMFAQEGLTKTNLK